MVDAVAVTSPFHSETHTDAAGGLPFHHRCKDKLALRLLKSLCVFSRRFPRCPPVNLNMYLLTIYNHSDAVIMCWD